MALNSTELMGFTGTERWHQWSPIFPRMLMTDGAKYVAENGGQDGAYWLMDAIASYQPALNKMQSLRQFQLWTLEVDTANRTAVLQCREDSDLPPIVTQKFDHTDFDLPDLRLYCMPAGDGERRTILLPSEY